MIDNFSQIQNLLKFDNKYEFYFIQVLQRSKENPQLGSNNRLIKAYYCFSKEYLGQRKVELVKLAEVFNARIYIHLNRRDVKRIGFEMGEDLFKRIKDDQLESIHRIFESTCGKHNSEKDKTWIIDIDTKEISYIDEVIKVIEDMKPIGDSKIVDIVETLNGYHIISKPFNSQDFGRVYPKLEVHKNNPTILYVP